MHLPKHISNELKRIAKETGRHYRDLRKMYHDGDSLKEVEKRAQGDTYRFMRPYYRKKYDERLQKELGPLWNQFLGIKL